MTEPVSLAEIKAHLRLDAGDASEDAYLAVLLTAARRACELRIDRAAVGKTATLTLDRFPTALPSFPYLALEVPQPDAAEIRLSGGTVASVTSITYFNVAGEAVVLDPASYIADLAESPARLAPVGAWPATQARPGAVSVIHILLPLDPDDLAVIKQAMLLLVGNWYENREGAVVDTRGMPTELPLAVNWLLWPLRRFAAS